MQPPAGTVSQWPASRASSSAASQYVDAIVKAKLKTTDDPKEQALLRSLLESGDRER